MGHQIHVNKKRNVLYIPWNWYFWQWNKGQKLRQKQCDKYAAAGHLVLGHMPYHATLSPSCLYPLLRTLCMVLMPEPPLFLCAATTTTPLISQKCFSCIHSKWRINSIYEMSISFAYCIYNLWVRLTIYIFYHILIFHLISLCSSTLSEIKYRR